MHATWTFQRRNNEWVFFHYDFYDMENATYVSNASNALSVCFQQYFINSFSRQKKSDFYANDEVSCLKRTSVALQLRASKQVGMCENHARILHFCVIKRKMIFRLANLALVITMIFCDRRTLWSYDFFSFWNSNLKSHCHRYCALL